MVAQRHQVLTDIVAPLACVALPHYLQHVKRKSLVPRGVAFFAVYALIKRVAISQTDSQILKKH